MTMIVSSAVFTIVQPSFLWVPGSRITRGEVPKTGGLEEYQVLPTTLVWSLGVGFVVFRCIRFPVYRRERSSGKIDSICCEDERILNQNTDVARYSSDLL